MKHKLRGKNSNIFSVRAAKNGFGLLQKKNRAPSKDGKVNPLMPNDVYRRRTVSPLKIKIPIKNMREKPTNTPINL
jgi:hypothetical protein